MAIGTLTEQFLFELGGTYDAEHQFLEAMRSMAEEARDEILEAMIHAHIIETEHQIRNLEQVYRHLDRTPERHPLASPGALVADGRRLMRAAAEAPALHDGIIAGTLAKVEAHEVACYRGLLAGAALLDRVEVVGLLRANLDEEEQIAQLAENYAATLAQRAASSGPGGGRHANGTGAVIGPLPGPASARDASLTT